MTARVRAGGRVWQLTEAFTFQEETRALPDPDAGEVVVRPTAVGICGTDLHAWRGRLDRLPIVPTHDGVGVVTAVGAHVDPALLGTRVVIDPVDQCGSCASCLAGHPGVCLAGGYLGMTVDGLLAERVALPAARVVPVPDSIGDDAATVLEPVAIGFRIRAEIAARGIAPGTALLIGGGPVGLLIGQLLAHDGWEVTIEEPSAERRARAHDLGLSAAAPGENTGWRATLVVDTSAVEPGTRAALAAAFPGALVVLLGRSPAGIPAADVLLREIDLLGVRGGAGYYADAVAAVARGAVDPVALIDEVHDLAELSDVEKAFSSHDSPTPPLRSVLHLP